MRKLLIQPFLDQFRQSIKHLKPFSLEIALIAALFSLVIDPLFTNVGYSEFNKFDRVFGQATLFGIDASARIAHFSFFVIFGLPLFVLTASAIVYAFICKKKEFDKEAKDYLHIISTIGLVLVFVYLYGKYDPRFSDLKLDYGLFVIGTIFSALLVYLGYAYTSLEKFKFSVALAIGASLSVNLLFSGKYGDKVYIGAFVFLCVFAVILAISRKTDLERLKMAALPIFLMLALGAFYLELTNILNQHNIFIINRARGLRILVLALFAISALLYFLTPRFINLRLFRKNYDIGLAALVVGLAMFVHLPPLVYYAGAELFEQANHGMLINDALKYGKIPLINSFDGHMLSHSLGGLLFGWLNNDSLGASYAQYPLFMVLASLVLYLLLRKVFNREFALLFSVFMPQFPFVFPFGYIGLLAIVALLCSIQEKSVKSFILLFLSIVFLILYEAPTGFSYGGGAFLVMLGVLLFDFIKSRKILSATHDNEKDKKAKKTLIYFCLSFIVFVVAWLVLFAISCLLQSINPFSRALEFSGIALSSNNWAYVNVGDRTSRNFALTYSLLPIVAIAGSVYSIINFKRNTLYVTALALFAAYFMNFNRALGRHSLAEDSYQLVVWTGVLALMFLFAAIRPKFGKQFFVATGVAMIVLFGVYSPYADKSLLQQAYAMSSHFGAFQKGANEKMTRVNLSAPLQTHKSVISMLNMFVPQSETYMDLSSQSMLYALTNHEKPVYINQSPLHLSGGYTQKQFIEQIRLWEGKCNYALLGGVENLDGIWNQYRYYLVHEYLYQHFRPLVKSSDGYALWVKKDKYSDSLAKLTSRNLTSTDFSAPVMLELEPIDYDYRDLAFHTYDLNKLPYIWGQYDKKKAWENPVVLAVTNGFIPAAQQSRSNYILLTIDADAKSSADLMVSNTSGSVLIQYKFALHRGNNRYIFRISSDWHWGNGQDLQLKLEGSALEQHSIELLAGD
ncbi:MAG: hypothetical protein LBE32_05305 [Burkholderiales bacterium]|jgi:hypothetical protein|nr:hypothetical protein [Burkholderiales bacterium]